MPHVLFISSHHEKPSHVKPAIENGYTISLIKQNPLSEDYQLFHNVIETNLFDLDDVLKKAEKLNSKQKIDGVLTRFEPYTPIVGAICDKLGLQPSFESTYNCRDKLAMRKVLEKNNISQPKFYESIPEAYPVLIKPTRGAKSRFLIKVNSSEEFDKKTKLLKNLIQNSKSNLFKPIKGIAEGSIIVEEILKGKQVTTTSFVINNEVHHIEIADLVTAQDLGIDGFYLISRTTPSVLSDEEKKQVYDLSTKATKVLGINNCCLHPEIMITEDGVKLLEIASRAGGFRPEMNMEAFGIDLNEIAINSSMGIESDYTKKKNKACTAVEVWPEKSGRLKGFGNMDDVLPIKGLKNFEIKRVYGNMYKIPPEGTKPIATFLTVADTPQKSKKIADDVLNKLEIIIE